MKEAAEKEPIAAPPLLTKGDQEGNVVSLAMWNHPTEDIYGMFSRNARVVENVELLLGAPVYLYSAKMVMKNAARGQRLGMASRLRLLVQLWLFGAHDVELPDRR